MFDRGRLIAEALLVAFAEVPLIWVKVLLFPFKASSSGLGDKPDLASPVLHLPMLRGVVEFDVAGPGDFEPAQFM